MDYPGVNVLVTAAALLSVTGNNPPEPSVSLCQHLVQRAHAVSVVQGHVTSIMGMRTWFNALYSGTIFPYCMPAERLIIPQNITSITVRNHYVGCGSCITLALLCLTITCYCRLSAMSQLLYSYFIGIGNYWNRQAIVYRHVTGIGKQLYTGMSRESASNLYTHMSWESASNLYTHMSRESASNCIQACHGIGKQLYTGMSRESSYNCVIW